MRHLLSAALLSAALAAPAAAQDMGMHQHMMAPAAGAAPLAPDTRQVVDFPPAVRQRTLASMRDHLAALGDIQDALAKGDLDRAGDIAEKRLGMSSMALHGGHEAAQYMPEGMRATGGEMHRAASRLALAAYEAGASDDLKPVLAAMGKVMAQCAACHNAYRVQ